MTGFGASRGGMSAEVYGRPKRAIHSPTLRHFAGMIAIGPPSLRPGRAVTAQACALGVPSAGAFAAFGGYFCE